MSLLLVRHPELGVEGEKTDQGELDKIVDVLGNDMSRALRLAASVQRAFPCSDPLVMTLAAKVFGKFF